MRATFAVFSAAFRAVRFARLAVLLTASLAAGVVCDWFRAEQRLVFPRPLPVFTTTPPSR